MGRVVAINVLGFLVQIILTLSTYQKDRKKFCALIMLSRLPDVPCYLLANDYASIGFSLLGGFRAYLTYKDKYTLKVACAFEIIIVFCTLLLNKLGWIVIFPLIGSTICNFYFLCKDQSAMIVISIFNNFIYIFYFVMIQNYAGSIMLVLATLAQMPSLVNNLKQLRQKTKQI